MLSKPSKTRIKPIGQSKPFKTRIKSLAILFFLYITGLNFLTSHLKVFAFMFLSCLQF